jgi:hypothetical protein
MDANNDVSDRLANAAKGVSNRAAAAGAAGIITLCIFFVELIIKAFG